MHNHDDIYKTSLVCIKTEIHFITQGYTYTLKISSVAQCKLVCFLESAVLVTSQF